MENSINVGVGEKLLATGNRYQVFPNPVAGSFIQVEVQSLTPERISFSLFDLSGKQVLESKFFDAVTGRSTFSVPLGVLKNGIYLLSITGKNWTAVELIMVLR
jgi:hypothetical protein